MITPSPTDNIVLTLDPAIFAFVTPNVFRGMFRKKGRIRRVPYGPLGIPLPSLKCVDEGVEALGRAIVEALDDCTRIVWVVGFSQGAQVINKWLRINVGSDLPADRLRFVCLGDPEREYGGVLRVESPPRKITGEPKFVYGCECHPDPGIPDDVPFPVYNVAREFDGYASVPRCAKPSRAALRLLSDAYHMDYFTVTLRKALSYRKPGTNITYVLIPTTNFASKSVIAEFGYPDWVKGVPDELFSPAL